MDRAAYLNAFDADSARLIEAARQGLDAPVASCPGWNVGQMIGHVLGVYLYWEKRMSGGPGEAGRLTDEELEDRYPGLLAWFQADYPRETLPPQVLDWLEQATRQMRDTLAGAAPDKPVDTWFPPDQTAGFVQRRMAQETAVHRWDAQAAHGQAEPIEPELARDGIDELLDVILPIRRELVTPRASTGERYHFHRTDGEGEWFIEFLPDRVAVSRQHAKGDVAIRGSASDLLLFLWMRLPAERLQVHGDPAIVDRWFELVPPG